jgi:hypothetical protein
MEVVKKERTVTGALKRSVKRIYLVIVALLPFSCRGDHWSPADLHVAGLPKKMHNPGVLPPDG